MNCYRIHRKVDLLSVSGQGSIVPGSDGRGHCPGRLSDMFTYASESNHTRMMTQTAYARQGTSVSYADIRYMLLYKFGVWYCI